LQPDDIVVVAEGHRVYVSGEVKTPGGYLYEQGMTIHKALSLAGGMTDKADHRLIKVTRLQDGVANTLHVELETPVMPDDIIVIEPQMHRVYVSGEVRSPGGYPYKEGLTIHKALAMAGGLTEKAERGKLTVLRHVSGREESVPVQLETPVQPEDTIVIAEGQKIYLSGEVKTPGRYLYERGMTVHKALSMAGGLTDKAERDHFKVLRHRSGAEQAVAVTLDTVILPEDIIVVAESRKFYVTGEVKTPGRYVYESGLTVHKAVTMAGGFTDKAAERRTKVLRIVDGEERAMAVKLDALLLPDDIILVPQSFF
jgi:polysaccharide biosynthesis/export protein